MINFFAGSNPPSIYIAAITASTLSASIAGLLFPPDLISEFPKYKNFPKLCAIAILCRLFSHTTVALTFVNCPSCKFKYLL